MRQTSTLACPEEMSTRLMSEPQAAMTSHIPSIAQCGLYAAEMLCGSLGESHSISLFIVGMLMWLLFVSQTKCPFVTDDVVWIVYTDLQGVIQSQGINFLRDLPSFFVLLYAHQRLELNEWGLNTFLDDRVSQLHHGAVYNDINGIHEKASWYVNLNLFGPQFDVYGQNILHSALTMAGRGTVVVECRSADNPEVSSGPYLVWK